LGIELRVDLGPNQDMKKMIWFALLLAGCGCHYRPRRFTQDPPPPPPPFDGGNRPAPEREVVPVSVSTAAPADENVPPIEHLPPKSAAGALAQVNAALEDAYFPYDRAELTSEALTTLRRDAELLCAILADFPGLKVTLEGHCDERGSAEYNLALGDRRAHRAEEVLREYGVPAAAIETVSYGKESPQCVDANEACWKKNRRAHITVRR
jgi:peptidoglycan-associated lipoprotein